MNETNQTQSLMHTLGSTYSLKQAQKTFYSVTVRVADSLASDLCYKKLDGLLLYHSFDFRFLYKAIRFNINLWKSQEKQNFSLRR